MRASRLVLVASVFASALVAAAGCVPKRDLQPDQIDKLGALAEVMDVQATVADPQYAGSEIGQCIVQAVKRWNFPSSDAPYETELPFVLTAE